MTIMQSLLAASAAGLGPLELVGVESVFEVAGNEASIPAGTLAGDLLVGVMASRTSLAAAITPSGWTQRYDGIAGARVYSKVADGNETTFSPGGETSSTVTVVYALRNAVFLSAGGAFASPDGIVVGGYTFPAPGFSITAIGALAATGLPGLGMVPGWVTSGDYDDGVQSEGLTGHRFHDAGAYAGEVGSVANQFSLHSSVYVHLGNG